MSACDHFSQNAWRPELCSTCQRAKGEHTGVSGSRSEATHSRSSWRRRSEPNPNNAVSGVRISALASKFQGREQRSGSIPEPGSTEVKETPAFPAHRPLKSSHSHEDSGNSRSGLPPRSRLNGSRSADLLDAAVPVTSESATTPSAKATVVTSSSASTPSPGAASRAAALHVKSSSSPTHSARVTSESAKAKPAGGKEVPAASSRKSDGTAANEKVPKKRGGKLSVKIVSTSGSSSKVVSPSSCDSGLKDSVQSGVSPGLVKASVKPRGRQVSIPDRVPEVIGTDGGLDNLVTDSLTSDLPEDSGDIYLSLTDEEKQFALLALGNTVWNSDTRNLQVCVDKRACREFEELEVQKLWARDGFPGGPDRQAEAHTRPFGTFPQGAGDKSSGGRVTVGQIKFDQTSQESGEKGGGMKSSESRVAGRREVGERKGPGELPRGKTAGQCGPDRKSSGPASGQSGSWLRYGDSSSSADSGVELGGEQTQQQQQQQHMSYSVGDITDCLYQTPEDAQTDAPTVALTGKHGDDSNHGPPPQAKSRSGSAGTGSRKMSGSGEESQGSGVGVVADMSLDSVQAIALLNDVLKDYADLNESSTDDLDPSDPKKDAAKGKKSSDFEARMACVAATLDLTKQRGKRQAPRPPLSPPPEPVPPPGVSPKKQANQPEPVFKMVPVGKSIVSVPALTDLANKPSTAPAGLEDFVLADGPESPGPRANGEGGKAKKGITSFFKSFLRRGKESSESFESLNPDIQLTAKSEVREGGGPRTDSLEEDTDSSSVDHRAAPKSSPQAKVLLIPATTSSPAKVTEDVSAGGDSAPDTPPPHLGKVFPASEAESSVDNCGGKSGPGTATSSPASHRKSSKGLASPKMILRRATAKFSPPASRHAASKHSEPPEGAPSGSNKPFTAPKPSLPPPDRPATTATTAAPSSATTASLKDATATSVGQEVAAVVRRRAKSPKRTAPPVPPGRTGGGGTLPRPDSRRSMPVPPPSPPGERKEKDRSGSPSSSPPVSPIPETEHSLPSSPSSPSTFEFPSHDWPAGSTTTLDEDPPRPSDRIELPTVAHATRKGLLGKLAPNRKQRAPQPPSVKRAKSITESSTLPRGDKKNKKINVCDISAPVMVTDMNSSSSRVGERRRNTISLGDDPAFAAVPGQTAASVATSDKEGFDEFDFPVLSPLGSLENLYEAILPKSSEEEGGRSFHYYDPPTGPRPLCPNVPADGYLEPVTPLSVAAAATATSTATTTTTTTTASLTSSMVSAATPPTTSLPSSSSSSLPSSSFAVGLSSSLKSPARTKPVGGASGVSPASQDSSSSHSGQATSGSSSEGENSGGSLTDTAHAPLAAGAKVSVGGVAGQGAKVKAVSSSSGAGVGAEFVEPELTEQRRLLLATQPIYEEIPNGEGELGVGGSPPSLPPAAPLSEMTKAQMAHAWLQQPHVSSSPPPTRPPPATTAATPAPASTTPAPSSLSSSSSSAIPPSPSHSSGKPVSMTTSNLMTASMTSSMLPPPPPPPDTLPAPPPTASRSVSRETVSSESDSQSNCSTLSRPRPAPRRKARRPDTGGSDQYVSMNRPNAQVSLSEERVRDVLSSLSSISFQALQDVYGQCERLLAAPSLQLARGQQLKWSDFDIYGQPLHSSGRCVVYNAKLRASAAPCQLMILHSRPATSELTTSSGHPSLLRPASVFADAVPFSFLSPDFVKTSQLLQNSVYHSTQARCFVAVGNFEIVESLDGHLALLRETLTHDPGAYLNVILTAAVQLLSAMSHCLDQGFSVTETDYNDVFLLTRADLRGKVVAFLPHQRASDVPQGEAMCNFLDRLLSDAALVGGEEEEELREEEEEEGEGLLSSPSRTLATLRSLLAARRVECLGQLRTAVEYLLWGPPVSEVSLSPVSRGTPGSGSACEGVSGREQDLYVWLEKERAQAVGRLACSGAGLGAGLTLDEFYTLKFLLKSSAGCLAESLRRLRR